MTTIRVTDDTPTLTVREVIEARTRRLMAERARVACWGEGRRERQDNLADIDASLDEWLALS